MDAKSRNHKENDYRGRSAIACAINPANKPARRVVRIRALGQGNAATMRKENPQRTNKPNAVQTLDPRVRGRTRVPPLRGIALLRFKEFSRTRHETKLR